jgi:H+-transporting ATPase
MEGAQQQYKDISSEQAFDLLEATPDGLGDDEAARRLDQYGPNEITEKRESPVVSLMKRFIHPFSLMIEFAIVISIILRDWPDVVLITCLLALNVSVDFIQERKSEGVLDSLRSKMAVRARVRRSGKWKTVESADLVPGDVILVSGGDIVPADSKLFDGKAIEVDESVLTGESLPVEKGKDELVYSSSIVSRGEMQALVVQTGEGTFFGRTASLAEEKPGVSHFERGVNNIGKYIVALAFVCMAGIIVVSSVVRHAAFGQVLLLTLTLAVASIPAALPAVLTVVMTVGATHLANVAVLVRRLPAIEELASADIICSDKTGTLTTGKLEMGEPILYGAVSRSEALEMAVLCSNYPTTEDPIDKAIVLGSQGMGFDAQETGGWDKTDYTPADSSNKRAAVIVNQNGKRRRIIKGAPQVVLAACDVESDVAERYLKDVDDFAGKGYRAVGVAYKDAEPQDEDTQMTLVAVLPLRDPPREDTKETLDSARELGITVKMITGDHAAAAKQIGEEIGIEGELVTADEIASWSDEEFAAKAERYSIFSQVMPESKYRIVDALKKESHVVGMTGDGVNDSPALKKADVGIAVDGANDVARAASDVILTQPGLKVIINGVREGKMVFARMKNYVIYRISETLRLVVFITLVVLIFNVKPIGPHQIILLAILNDIPILMIAGDHVTPAVEPESWGMSRLITIGTVLGATGVITSFLMYFILHHFVLTRTITLGQLQTAMFLKFAISGHMLFFVARSRSHWWSKPFPSRGLLAAILGTMAVSTTISTVGLGSFLPAISPLLTLAMWAWCLVWMQVADGAKLFAYRILDRHGRGQKTTLIVEPMREEEKVA